jgi:hypothetical protein
MTGFNSKCQATADKLQEPYDQTALELCNVCGWKTLIPDDGCLNCERAQSAQDVNYWIRESTAARQAEMALRRELEAQSAQEPVEYQMQILGGRWTHCAKHIYDAAADKSIVRALYTHQPKGNT